jgi:hypothetical protein
MSGKRITRKHDATALAVLVIMLAWFNHEMILTGRIPFFRDLGLMFYPMRFSLAESLKSWELPLWNRHIGMGFPLMANVQSEVFYLPNVFFLTLSFFSAIRAIFIFHYLVAGIGAYVLCRKWGHDSYLAIVGALLFTLGGTIVSLSNLLNHFQAAVWLPWVIFFWERCLERQSWKNVIALAAVLLMQFLAGSPEFYAMSMGLVFLDALRLRSLGSGPSYARILLLLLAVNLLTLSLAMVQVLPALELLRESRTKFPLPLQLASSWSLRPSQLLNLFFLDREVAPERLNGMEILFEPSLPFFVSYYMGAMALIGLSLWSYYASWKEKGLLLAVIIISLTLAFGEYTPLFAVLFHHVPGFGLFRFPEKFFFMAYAVLIYVALRGISAFMEYAPSAPRVPLLILSGISLVFLSLYLVFQIDISLLGRLISEVTQAPFLSDSTSLKASFSLLSIERQLALTLAIIGLLVLKSRNVIRVGLFNALIVSVVFFDLHSAHESYQYLLKPDFIYRNHKILPRPGPEPYRIFYYPGASNLHPSYYTLLKKPSFAEFNSLAFTNVLPNTGLFYGFDYMQELDALIRWPYNLFLAVGNRLPYDKLINLLGALNVRYLYSFQPLPGSKNVNLQEQFEEYSSWLYRIDRVVPRTYVVSQAEEEKDPVKILRKLADAQFDPLSRVLLDQPVSFPRTDKFHGQARITAYKNQSVIIRASLNSPAVLVLADSYYPGWQAYVDGKQQKILRANLFFRAVVLSQGEHTVEFRYEPRSFTIGLAISLTTLCALVLVSGYVYLRGRGARNR